MQTLPKGKRGQSEEYRKVPILSSFVSSDDRTAKQAHLASVINRPIFLIMMMQYGI
jgi:hypothetical protein